MALAASYKIGSATAANGSPNVTGIGTAWSATILPGDTFEGADGRSAEVLSVTDNTHLVLDRNWPGTDQTAAYYRIFYGSDGNRIVEKSRQAIEALRIPQTGMPMIFDGSGITDIDPGAGRVRFNSATAPTIAFVSKTDALGGDISGRLATLDDSTNSVSRAVFSFQPTDGANAFADFDVTGALTDATAYSKVPVTLRAGAVPADKAALAMTGVPTGGDGADGADGTNGVLSAVELVKTADYAILAADKGKTIIANKATPISFSFDAAATLGATWMTLIKNIGAGTLTLTPNGAETIDGAASATLTTGQSAEVSSNGTALRTFRGAGGIAGSTGATDNRLLRADGTGGATAQASAITVDDSGNISGAGTINGNPILSVASQSDQESATSTTAAVTPGYQQSHPSAAKMWGDAVVTGGVPTLKDSYNITSISDGGVGLMGVVIATDFSSINWAPIGMVIQSASFSVPLCSSIAAGSFNFFSVNTSQSGVDPTAYSWAGYGDQ